MTLIANEEATITFTPELRDDLRRAHKDAVDHDLDRFEWNGGMFLTDFAGYLLEYLDIQFKGTLQ
jgi:hypothetical protein